MRIELIINDILRTQPRERLAEPYEISADLVEEYFTDHILAFASDVPSLINYLREYIGKAMIIQTTRSIGVRVPERASMDDLISCWLRFRGIGDERPGVRPLQLADELKAKAAQAQVSPTVLSDRAFIAGPLRKLLSYMCLYYGAQLLRARQRSATEMTTTTMTDLVDRILSYDDAALCDLLDCAMPISARPYYSADDSRMVLVSEEVSSALESIRQFSLAPEELFLEEEIGEYAIGVSTLLEYWQSEAHCIPRGCRVLGVTAEFTKYLTCCDESGGRVVVQGVRGAFQEDDLILLNAEDGNEVPAPRLEPLPNRPELLMSDDGSRDLRSELTTESTTKAELPTQPSKRVFISYAHDSDVHKNLVYALYGLLRDHGVDAVVDVVMGGRPVNWAAWISTELGKADYVLCVASPEYRRRGDEEGDATDGRGVRYEAALIRDAYYDQMEEGRKRFLSVVLPGRSAKELPRFLQPNTANHFRVEPINLAGIDSLLRYLTNQPLYPVPPLGPVPALPPYASGPSPS